jgi:CRP-like cAMP-binding protein
LLDATLGGHPRAVTTEEGWWEGDPILVARLASRLVRIANESGRTLRDGAIRLPSPLTQGDLAAMIGCTRQSVNKLLGMFTDDGLIRLDRDSIVVLDLDGLTKIGRR